MQEPPHGGKARATMDAPLEDRPTEPDRAEPDRDDHRVRRGLFTALRRMLVVALVTAGLVFGLLWLSGTTLRLPVWALVEAEARINRVVGPGLGEGNSVVLGGAAVRVDADWVPRIQLDDLRLVNAAGATILTLPEIGVAIDPVRLAEGELRPKSLKIVGPAMTLRRLPDGRFDLLLPAFTGPPPANLAELLDRVENAFALPAFGQLDRIEVEALSLSFDDLRAGHVWQIGDGNVLVENRSDSLSVRIGFGLVAGGRAPSTAELTFVSDKRTSAAEVTATVDDVAARDLAAQAPVLAWLGVLDAPISGRLAAALNEGGRLGTLDGTLSIDAGALAPTEATRPVPFEHAGLSFRVDMDAETIGFSDLSVDSASLRLKASGLTRVPGMGEGRIEAFVTQVRLDTISLDPEGVFETPAVFSDGAVETRLTLEPFRLEVGQLSLSDGDTRLVGKGEVSAEPGGWRLAADLSVNRIGTDRVVALWPSEVKPRTRAWVARSIQSGTLRNATAAVRLDPGKDPRLSIAYEFDDAEVTFLRGMPNVRSAFGHSSLSDDSYTVYLDRGTVTAPEGGDVDVSGSVFRIPDVRLKPATAEITLRTDSRVTAALSLLDQPPLGFVGKVGFPVDLAGGRAVATSTLSFPIQPKVALSDVDFEVDGRLRDVRSDMLVEGRVLTAADLRVRSDRAGLQIGGAGLLGTAPFDATWTQRFGADTAGKSRIAGQVELSQASLDEFDVALPEGAFGGSAIGDVEIDLERGGTGTFRITSDLRGATLRLAPIGLDKPAGAAAALDLAGRLGTPAVIDRLTLDSGPVSVAGSVSLRPDGGLDVARFSEVKSGDWLNATVDITGQGAENPVDIAVTGGWVDLGRLPDTGDATGGGPPIDMALDRLQVTESIALTGFRGRFANAGGLSGDFTARVNDAAKVRGSVMPVANGMAARIWSDDAGGVLAGAGIFERARGGTLDLTLMPSGGRGNYDGRATVENVSVRDAPVLAELLNAISVVGLLEQFGSSGINFSSAETTFRISPQGVRITSGSATGASIGATMTGLYDAATRSFDMEGVISPIYMLNGIGSILTRRGEGVFGFNYRLSGTTDAPVVSVNPLSILTPGVLRELFRGARAGEAVTE